MILRQHRCCNCKARYTYQASGWGAIEFNDADYCPKCKKGIVVALRAIPPVCEHKWIPTNDVLVKTLVDIENEQWKAIKVAGGIPVRRVQSPLFNLEDPSNHHRNGIVKLSGKTYRYEYWTKWGMEKGRVYIEAEVRDGEIIGPWSLHDFWMEPLTVCEHDPWPESEPTHEFVVQPFDMSKLQMPRIDIIERDQSLASIADLDDE